MLIRAWRFIAIILASLSMAMAFCHLLEMPPRLGWDASLWVGATVIGNVYSLFGSVGAFVETGAMVAAVALAIMVRRRGPAVSWLTAAAAALLVAAFVGWWLFVFPVNVEMAGWTADSVPPDWSDWRSRWEYAHAIRALLLIAGFASLVLSVIVETPAGATRKREAATVASGRIADPRRR